MFYLVMAVSGKSTLCRGYDTRRQHNSERKRFPQGKFTGSKAGEQEKKGKDGGGGGRGLGTEYET